MRKLKFAVVGCGQIARERMVPAILNSKRAELVAVVDVDERVARTTADLYKIPYCYSSLEEMLQNDLVEVVYIATPNHLHCDNTTKAANQGKHVLCEKPMATSTEDCRRMIESCDKNEVKLMVGYMSRFNLANIMAKRLISEGAIGKPTVVKSQFAFVKMPRSDDWRLDLRKSGGGCLLDIGVYSIDFTDFLFNERIIEVTASSGNTRFNYPVEDLLIVSFRLSKGAMGDFVCGYNVRIPSSFEVYGTEGSIILNEPFDQKAIGELQLICKDKEEKHMLDLNAAPYACYQRELEHFCECIEEDKEPIPNGEIGLYSIEVIESIYRSAKTQKNIKITANLE